jgi:hypothetical protein
MGEVVKLHVTGERNIDASAECLVTWLIYAFYFSGRVMEGCRTPFAAPLFIGDAEADSCLLER